MARIQRRKILIVTPLSESVKHSTQTPKGRVFKGVTLIKAGLGNRRDKNFYPPEVLKAAVQEGMFEGLRAFADHPDSVSEEIQPERTIRDLVGVYENARFDDPNQSVRADLRILESQKWLSNTIDELIDIGHADKIGLSINGRGATEPVKRQLEESGEEQEVNELRKFLELRSTDVVTEAGAGGGFSQLLESARRVKESTEMNREKLLKAIGEAAATGDETKVLELSTQLAETGEATADGETREAFPPGKKAPPFGKKKGKAMAEPDEDDVAESDDEEDIDDMVDDAVEEAAEGDEAEDEEDEDVTEADDEEEEDGDDVAEAGALVPMYGSGQKVRGSTGKTGTVQGGGSFHKNAKRPKKATKSTKPGSTNRVVRTTGGAQMVESTKDAVITRLQRKNERLAEALQVALSGNSARKLLKEANLPDGVAATLVDDLIGKDEATQRREIAKHRRVYEAMTRSITESVKSSMGDEFTEVEGAGSRIRESHGGSRETDFEEVFESAGLPLK